MFKTFWKLVFLCQESLNLFFIHDPQVQSLSSFQCQFSSKVRDSLFHHMVSQMARLLFQRTWWEKCFIWMTFMNKTNVRGIISVQLFIYLFSYSMQSAGGQLRDWPSLQFMIEYVAHIFLLGRHWQVPELLLKGHHPRQSEVKVRMGWKSSIRHIPLAILISRKLEQREFLITCYN